MDIISALLALYNEIQQTAGGLSSRRRAMQRFGLLVYICLYAKMIIDCLLLLTYKSAFNF